MRRLLIVGASGFGREVMDWASAVPPEKRDWEMGGFLDSRSGILDGLNVPYPIFGDADTFSFGENDCFVCAIGDPRMRLDYGRRLMARGAKIVNLIHPSAIIGSGGRLGIGCIVSPGVYISNHVTIGDFVAFNVYATVGHDAVIGDGCTFSSHTDVTGWAVLGEGVFLGSHASVLPRVRVADYTVVGAGSTVLRPTAPRTTVMGVPAKRVF